MRDIRDSIGQIADQMMRAGIYVSNSQSNIMGLIHQSACSANFKFIKLILTIALQHSELDSVFRAIASRYSNEDLMTEVFGFLKDQHADIEKAFSPHYSLAMRTYCEIALECNNFTFIKTILKTVDISQISSAFSFKSLVEAFKNGHYKAIQVLLELLFDQLIPDESHYTRLMS